MIENMLNITKTRHAKTTASAEELNSIREDYDRSTITTATARHDNSIIK